MKKIILTEDQYQRLILDRIVSSILQNNEEYRKKLETDSSFLTRLYDYAKNKVKNFFGQGMNNGNKTGQMAQQGYQGPGATSVSERGVNMISMFETSRPFGYKMGYDDLHGKSDGGHKAYGYGLRNHPDGIHFMDEKPIWTQEELETLYIETINKKVSQAIVRWARRHGLTLSQHQFDAIASIAYNVGPGVLDKYELFTSIIPSNPRDPNIAQVWNKTAITAKNENGERVPLQGLINRREKEVTLYLTGVYPF